MQLLTFRARHVEAWPAAPFAAPALPAAAAARDVGPPRDQAAPSPALASSAAGGTPGKAKRPPTAHGPGSAGLSFVYSSPCPSGAPQLDQGVVPLFKSGSPPASAGPWDAAPYAAPYGQGQPGGTPMGKGPALGLGLGVPPLPMRRLGGGRGADAEDDGTHGFSVALRG